MPEDTPAQALAKKMIKRFPIIGQPTGANVGGGSYDVLVKEYKISINKVAPKDDEIGRADAVVHLHCGEDLTGFTGGAYYKFLDEKGNVVFAIMGDAYGVNGKLVPGAPSEVDKVEFKPIPVEILTAIYGVEIVPIRMEGPALDRLKQTVSEFAKGADAIKDDLKKIGVTVAEIVAAIKAL